MEKVCSSKRDPAFNSSPPTEFVMHKMIQKRQVISHRHRTEGTGASEARLILQGSIRQALQIKTFEYQGLRARV